MFYVAEIAEGEWGVFQSGKFNSEGDDYCIECGLTEYDAMRKAEELNQ